jgi:hypothetical protein
MQVVNSRCIRSTLISVSWRVKFSRWAIRRHESCEPPRQETTAWVRFGSVVGLALRNSGSSEPPRASVTGYFPADCIVLLDAG